MISRGDHGRVIRRHDCQMPSGILCGRCCPSRCGAANGWTTARCSMGSWRSSAPGPLGVACPSGTAHGPHCTPVSAGVPWTARSRADAPCALARVDATGDIDWLVSVDSTVVHAHHHAAGAQSKGAVIRDSDVPGVA
jgi:hypothetical protein